MGGGSSKAKKKEESKSKYQRVSKEPAMVTVVSSKRPASRMKNDEKHSICWENPEPSMIPEISDRPLTTITESENIARITPMLEKLELHEGGDLDQDYILEIWGKYMGDKGNLSFQSPLPSLSLSNPHNIEFIREVKTLRFPKLRQLRLRWLCEFISDKEFGDISDFLK